MENIAGQPTNIQDFVQLTKEQAESLLVIMTAEKKAPTVFEDIWKEFEKTFGCQLIQKRIAAFKLQKFEQSAILTLLTMCGNHAGRLVLAMIDTLEARDRVSVKPEKINCEFICTYVYPWGTYTEEAFEREWHAHKLIFTEALDSNKIEQAGWNTLIVSR